jgi:hypothetical protein
MILRININAQLTIEESYYQLFDPTRNILSLYKQYDKYLQWFQSSRRCFMPTYKLLLHEDYESSFELCTEKKIMQWTVDMI